MNWDAIGAIAEALGAIGVIVTLIYLSLQLRSNTDMNRAVVRQNISDAMRGVTTVGLDDDSFSAMITKTGMFGDPTGGPLTPDELARFLRWTYTVLRVYENVYLQYLNGLYEKEYWETTAARITIFFSSPKTRNEVANLWSKIRPAFDPRFADEIEKFHQDSRYEGYYGDS